MTRPKFYLLGITYHGLLIAWFYGVAALHRMSLSGTFEHLIFGVAALVSLIVLNELARRVDLFLMSYDLRQWLWSSEPFPMLTASAFWLIKAAQVIGILGISAVLFLFWEKLHLIICGYALFCIGLLVFAGLDFLIHGYGKFCALREEGRWMSNLKFNSTGVSSRSRFR